MTDIDVMRARKTELEGRIHETSGRMRQFERAYNSLVQFKTVVESSRNDYNRINSGRSQVLEPLSEYTEINNADLKYYRGMSHTLAGIGMGVVGASYNGLVFMINNRLTWYRTQIDNCQQTITSCGWQIGSLENDIRYAEDELRRNELLETSENG